MTVKKKQSYIVVLDWMVAVSYTHLTLPTT